MTDTPDIVSSASPHSSHMRTGDHSPMQSVAIRESRLANGILGAALVMLLWAGLHLFWSSQELRLLQEHTAENKQDIDSRIATLEAQVKQLQNQGPQTIIVKEITK